MPLSIFAWKSASLRWYPNGEFNSSTRIPSAPMSLSAAPFPRPRNLWYVIDQSQLPAGKSLKDFSTTTLRGRFVRSDLLLRSDLHRLFDRGYVTVTPERRLEVSRQLRDHFSNGRSYYPLHGQPVVVPRRPQYLPSSEALQWHNEHVFLT